MHLVFHSAELHFLVIDVSGFAFTDAELCADCEYSNGLGYVPGDNCHQFRQVRCNTAAE